MRWFPDPNQFLSDYDEIHAFVIGVADGFLFWQKRDIPEAASEEYHYYRSAMVLGFMLFCLFITGLVLILRVC